MAKTVMQYTVAPDEVVALFVTRELVEGPTISKESPLVHAQMRERILTVETSERAEPFFDTRTSSLVLVKIMREQIVYRVLAGQQPLWCHPSPKEWYETHVNKLLDQAAYQYAFEEWKDLTGHNGKRFYQDARVMDCLNRQRNKRDSWVIFLDKQKEPFKQQTKGLIRELAKSTTSALGAIWMWKNYGEERLSEALNKAAKSEYIHPEWRSILAARLKPGDSVTEFSAEEFETIAARGYEGAIEYSFKKSGLLFGPCGLYFLTTFLECLVKDNFRKKEGYVQQFHSWCHEQSYSATYLSFE